MPKKQTIKLILYLSKYLFALVLLVPLFAAGFTGKRGVICSFFEFMLVFLLTNVLARRHRVAAYVCNGLMLFIANIQNVIAYFASSFVSLQMLSNLDSLADLSGNFTKYGVAVFLVLVFSFLPVAYIRFRPRCTGALFACCAAGLVFSVAVDAPANYSPYYALGSTAWQGGVYFRMRHLVRKSLDDVEFYGGGYKIVSRSASCRSGRMS